MVNVVFWQILFFFLPAFQCLLCGTVLPLWFFSSIMVKSPTIIPRRDAQQFRPFLPYTQSKFTIQLRSRWTDAVVPVPPRTWGLEDTQPRHSSWLGARRPLQLPAGPSWWIPESATSSRQLWRALQTGRDLIGSGFGVSEPPLHAAAARRTCGTERHHHGSSGTQNPEHATGPQEGVGVSIKDVQRQSIPLKSCLNMINLHREGSKEHVNAV